jgi:hypothetical protein
LNGWCHHASEQRVELLLQLNLAVSWNLEVNLFWGKEERETQMSQQKQSQRKQQSSSSSKMFWVRRLLAAHWQKPEVQSVRLETYTAAPVNP